MTDNRTTELLPCPICGGQPDIQHFNITPNVQGRIICACGIELRQGKNDTEDDMRIIWNARAELGSGTCSIVKTWSDSDYVDDWRYRCSECGCNIPVNERDPETGDVINAANFCPNCGRKVVGA